MAHLGRKLIGFAGALAVLYGGSKLYNKYHEGSQPPAPTPTPAQPSGGGGTSGGGGGSTPTAGQQAAAQAAQAAGGTDAAGNTVQQILSGGTLTGSGAGDTNGLYTTAGSGDTTTATNILSGDIVENTDTSGSDGSSSDANSILSDATAAVDIGSLFG